MREPEHTILANLSSPHTVPLQGLLSQILCQSIFCDIPLASNEPLDLYLTTAVEATTTNSYIQKYIAKPNAS